MDVFFSPLITNKIKRKRRPYLFCLFFCFVFHILGWFIIPTKDVHNEKESLHLMIKVLAQNPLRPCVCVCVYTSPDAGYGWMLWIHQYLSRCNVHNALQKIVICSIAKVYYITYIDEWNSARQLPVFFLIIWVVMPQRRWVRSSRPRLLLLCTAPVAGLKSFKLRNGFWRYRRATQ